MNELTVSELNVLARKSGQSMRSRMVTPHPASERVCAANVEWLRRYQLVSDDLAFRKLVDIRCGLLAAYAFPRAPEALVSICADLISWLFPFDDRYGEGGPGDTLRTMEARFATYLEVIRTGKLPSEANQFHRAILDLCERCRALADDPDCWIERFSESFRTYFDGCLQERPYRCSTMLLHLDEYRRIRELSIGLFPYLDLILLSGVTLSANDFEHPTLLRLQTSAALLCAWANDVYSFAKETRDGGDPMNIVSVLANEFELSIPAAMGAAVEIYKKDLAVFENEIETLNGIGAGIRNYVQGLEDWVHGVLAWHAISARYA